MTATEKIMLVEGVLEGRRRAPAKRGFWRSLGHGDG